MGRWAGRQLADNVEFKTAKLSLNNQQLPALTTTTPHTHPPSSGYRPPDGAPRPGRCTDSRPGESAQWCPGYHHRRRRSQPPQSVRPPGVSWCSLGVSRRPLGVSRCPLGVSWCPLGVSWCPLGVSRRPLGYHDVLWGITMSSGGLTMSSGSITMSMVLADCDIFMVGPILVFQLVLPLSFVGKLPRGCTCCLDGGVGRPDREMFRSRGWSRWIVNDAVNGSDT